jgi:signal transduction histidine kinase
LDDATAVLKGQNMEASGAAQAKGSRKARDPRASLRFRLAFLGLAAAAPALAWAIAASQRFDLSSRAAAAVLAAAAACAAWVLLARHMRAQVATLEETTLRWAEGDFTARTGLASVDGDLGRVARALDHLAEGLQGHERELKSTKAAVRGALDQAEALRSARAVLLQEAARDLGAPLGPLRADLDQLRMGQVGPLTEHQTRVLDAIERSLTRLEGAVRQGLDDPTGHTPPPAPEVARVRSLRPG